MTDEPDDFERLEQLADAAEHRWAECQGRRRPRPVARWCRGVGCCGRHFGPCMAEPHG